MEAGGAGGMGVDEEVTESRQGREPRVLLAKGQQGPGRSDTQMTIRTPPR